MKLNGGIDEKLLDEILCEMQLLFEKHANNDFDAEGRSLTHKELLVRVYQKFNIFKNMHRGERNQIIPDREHMIGIFVEKFLKPIKRMTPPCLYFGATLTASTEGNYILDIVDEEEVRAFKNFIKHFKKTKVDKIEIVADWLAIIRAKKPV